MPRDPPVTRVTWLWRGGDVIRWLRRPYAGYFNDPKVAAAYQRPGHCLSATQWASRSLSSGAHSRDPLALPILRANSGDRDGESRGHPDRLFMAPAERVAIGGLDEPTKLAVCRRPNHPLQGDLARNLCPATRSCVTQLRTRADHKLDMLVDRERLLEKKISFPLSLTRSE